MTNPDIPMEQKLLQALHLLVNSARIHQDNNRILMNAVEQFTGLVEQFCSDGDDLTLFYSENTFYLQEEKIVFDRLTSTFANLMLEYFERRSLEGLRFNPSMRQAPLSEISAFFRDLNESDKQDEPAVWLEHRIETNRLTWVEHIRVSQVSLAPEQNSPGIAPGSASPEALNDPKKTASSGTEPGKKGDGSGAGNGEFGGKKRQKKKKSGLQTYGYAVLSLKDVAQKISGNKRPGIKKTMRLAQNMVDMVVEDNQMFLSLSTIRDYDDYTFTHSINVAILSICLGHRIGLSKSSLETLSLGALFHDLGKIDVPKEILNKPGKLDGRELQIMKKHSLDSVRRIIKLKTTRQKKRELLLPPFEHHLKYDLSGYPKTPRKKPLSLFGRIICIADVFDALTAPRIYRPRAWSPDHALGFMLERSGLDFDPVLLKIFTSMIGIYPIGTLLKLDNNEMGLVARYAAGEGEGKELWVQLLDTDDSGSFSKGDLVSLGPWNTGTASFNRPVLESFHPSVYGIQPAEYIM